MNLEVVKKLLGNGCAPFDYINAIIFFIVVALQSILNVFK